MNQETLNYLMCGGVAGLAIAIAYLNGKVDNLSQSASNNDSVNAFLLTLKVGQLSCLVASLSHGRTFSNDFMASLDDNQKFCYSSLLLVLKADSLSKYYPLVSKAYAERIKSC